MSTQSKLLTCVVRSRGRFLHRSGKCAACCRCCCCSRFYLSRLRFISDDAYVMTGRSRPYISCLDVQISVSFSLNIDRQPRVRVQRVGIV